MEYVEFAAQHELEGDVLRGVAHVFGERTRFGGELWEFDPKSFDASIKAKAIVAYYVHDKTKPLAAQSVDSLKIGRVKGEDGRQRVEYEFALGRQSYAVDLRESVESGLIRQASFGMFVVPGGSTLKRDSDGRLYRLHTAADVWDISPVPVGAFGSTSTHFSETLVSERERRIRAVVRAGG